MKRQVVAVVLFLLLIPYSFAQTNGFVSFQFRIDIAPPVYSEYNSNTTSINAINECVAFSAYWTDEVRLNYYLFEWNITNSFENSTLNNFDNGWSNTTRIIDNPDYEGHSVYYKFFGFDKNNNMNETYFNSFSILNKAPSYSDIAESNPNPTPGDVITLSSHWADNFNVYSTKLQTNHSGTWIDNSTILINASNGWANYTWDTTGYNGETIYWKIIAEDNVLNSNETEIYSFTVSVS
ncbi:Uncharacterised protein [Candidatus Tiddalikarchaeum anstoanum]|nr:Uncharacterised protein [Candidatus Tiddalikarchaeum anstoanum]